MRHKTRFRCARDVAQSLLRGIVVVPESVATAFVTAVFVTIAAGFYASSAAAQDGRIVLVSAADSTRALALDSLTRMKEPFGFISPLPFGNDRRTRVMLFAMRLSVPSGADPSAFTAAAEDAAHRVHMLTVESVEPVPGQPWLTSIVVRLGDSMENVGDVLIQIRYQGIPSNRVHVRIGGASGGSLPDDYGAMPTPGIAPVMTPATDGDAGAGRAGTLTVDDVRTLIAQAVSAAASLNRAVTIAVVDREGNPLGVFAMTGAPTTTQLRGNAGQQLTPNAQGLVAVGLNGTLAPATFAAISKAGTGAFFSTSGNAFTTRTAGFIIQEHFPPSIDFRPGGPLYGVQFSSLGCSDIKRPGLPLGLSADPGGLPIYKNGVAVGGIGIEGDEVYGVDRNPLDFDQPVEETIATSAVRGYEAPAVIRGDNILVDGVRLPYVNVTTPPAPPTVDFNSLPGSINPLFPVRQAQVSDFTPATIGGIAGEVSTRFFPFRGSAIVTPNSLTAIDVNTIIAQAAQQANVTRAAIRQPLGSNARVSIAVVDAQGVVLGIFRQPDAPVFGFDVSVQKARTAAFFTRADAGARLRAAGFGAYVDRANADAIPLNGGIAFSDRAIGFLHRPFFPDGINDAAPAPFSTPLGEWSVFNVGLQLDLIKRGLEASLLGNTAPCSDIPGLANGIQIFAGSVPIYKNGEFVGAIGISGDGIDQDDVIAAAGASRGFAAPANLRADQVFVRGVRLPYVKFPRSPNL